MALDIFSQTAPVLDSMHGITRSARWSCDIFHGTSEALIAAGLLNAAQLTPQKGRAVGYTSFLPTGEACPPKQRAWRDPGSKAIRQQDDGTYSIEITVGKAEQLLRRKQEKAADYEAQQLRINKELEAKGQELSNWVLRQDFRGWCESWEGTKAQFQAAGLGIGVKFPGEPGAPQKVKCKCSLGFEFLISAHCYDEAKRAAGILEARSWYDPRSSAPRQFVEHARGVMREVWTGNGHSDSDYFHGTAEALVAAGLVPFLRYFPGQAGMNRMRASFVDGWVPSMSYHSAQWKAHIEKLGKSDKFSLQLPASPKEIERRSALRKAEDDESQRICEKLSAERKQLRQGVHEVEQSEDAFRAERARLADVYLNALWAGVFKAPEGALSFDIAKGDDLWDELAEAFQAIKEAVQEADVRKDAKHVAAAKDRLKLTAARNDTGLQSILRSAQSLRLVQSEPDDEGRDPRSAS